MTTDLPVRHGLLIPAAELHESASRSGGPGGQHVNKTNTRVTLRWNVAESAVLSEAQRRRLWLKLGGRLTTRGHLVVHAGRHRSRARNLALARERLATLVREALVAPRNRVSTKPSRASRERALAAKRRRSEIKKRRSRPRDDS